MDAHTHEHDENCSCGLHNHNHNHEHGHAHKHEHTHTHEHTVASGEIGVIRVESHLHDEARVTSGLVTLVGDEERTKAAIREQLEMLAKAVFELGGIVGHIKASCQTKTVEMFSVTDVSVMAKTSPEKEMRINLAAIVFVIDQDEFEGMVQRAMQTIKSAGLARE